MRSIKLIAPLAFLVLGAVVLVWVMSGAQATQVQAEAPAAADDGSVTQLMSENLPEFPGKEGVIVTVEYPPGGSTPIHRDNAELFVYVLEGSLVLQLRGGEETRLTPGQTFHEGPNDIHLVSRKRECNRTGEIRCVLRERYWCATAAACELNPMQGRANLATCSSKEHSVCTTTAIRLACVRSHSGHPYGCARLFAVVAHAPKSPT